MVPIARRSLNIYSYSVIIHIQGSKNQARIVKVHKIITEDVAFTIQFVTAWTHPPAMNLEVDQEEVVTALANQVTLLSLIAKLQ